MGYKMKGFSGYGNKSPLKQLKLEKEDYAKPGTKIKTDIKAKNEQIKPYLDLDLNTIQSNDTISNRTKDIYGDGSLYRYLIRNDFTQKDVGTMVGNSDLASKGKLSKGKIKYVEK